MAASETERKGFKPFSHSFPDLWSATQNLGPYRDPKRFGSDSSPEHEGTQEGKLQSWYADNRGHGAAPKQTTSQAKEKEGEKDVDEFADALTEKLIKKCYLLSP